MASLDHMSERLSLSEDRVVPDRVSEERTVSERDVQTTDLAVVVEKSEFGVQCDQSDMLMPIKKEVSTIACQTSPRFTERELSLDEGAVVKCQTCDSGCQAELLTERQQQHSIAVETDPDPEHITGPSAASFPAVNFTEGERRGAPPPFQHEHSQRQRFEKKSNEQTTCTKYVEFSFKFKLRFRNRSEFILTICFEIYFYSVELNNQGLSVSYNCGILHNLAARRATASSSVGILPHHNQPDGAGTSQ